MTAAAGLKKENICGNFKNKLLVFASPYGYPSSRGKPKGGCPLLNTAIEANAPHPGLRKKAIAALKAWKDDLVALIEGAMRPADTGDYQSGVSVHLMENPMNELILFGGSIALSHRAGPIAPHNPRAVVRPAVAIKASLALICFH